MNAFKAHASCRDRPAADDLPPYAASDSGVGGGAPWFPLPPPSHSACSALDPELYLTVLGGADDHDHDRDATYSCVASAYEVQASLPVYGPHRRHAHPPFSAAQQGTLQ